MVSPNGIKLAAHVISSFYGNLCSKVCECLLCRGTLNLAQIIQFTDLTEENVINCLRVLIHQNCVQSFAIQQQGAIDEAPRIVTQYMALFDNIIHKLRAPKIVQIVSEKLGEDCLGIFQGLIEHGSLSLNQIIERNKQTTGSSDVDVVSENFKRLLSARFVEHCPAPEPFLAPPSDTSEEQRTIEQRVLAAAGPPESMRFLLEIDNLADEKGEESANSVKVGKKRKQDALKSDEDVLDANADKEVLWRVNFEELVCHLRNKACISYVKTRINNEAAIVLSAILDLIRRSESQPKLEKTAYLSINAIHEAVKKEESGLGMDFERIRTSLNQLRCQTLFTEIDESYSVDIKSITEMAQNEELEAMVLRRYGREAYRIFRLLNKAGRLLETHKIADSTFVERKDAIKILYKLWKDEYIHMEKVLTKELQIFLWRVNEQSLREQFVDASYDAALNLRLRIAHQKDREKEVVQTAEERERLEKVREIFESSLMKLDDVILLFLDF